MHARRVRPRRGARAQAARSCWSTSSRTPTRRASRHAKRWQDVEELLDAGIDVCTTLNVQHVESLNDVVAQITGVARARDRARRGASSAPTRSSWSTSRPTSCSSACARARSTCREQAQRAVEQLLPQGNLIALRELALRRTAERVDAAACARTARDHGDRATWPTRERILVCVGPDARRPRGWCAPRSAWPTRSTRDWIAVYVETPALLRLSRSRARRRIERCCGWPSRSAPRPSTLDGPSPARRSLELRARAQRHARSSSASRRTRAGARCCGRSMLDELVRGSARHRRHVIARGDATAAAPRAAQRAAPREPQRAAAGRATRGPSRSPRSCTAGRRGDVPLLRAGRTS